MKTRALAVAVKTGDEKIITAFDAIYMREFYKDRYNKFRFYYLDNDKRRYEVFPKFIKANNTAFFAFRAGNKPRCVTEDSGESLTHFVAKKALSRLKTLRLIDVRKKSEIILNVVEGVNEKLFEFDKRYYVDVFFKLDKKFQPENMRKYVYKWEENLAIEIFVSHNVSPEKSRAFKENNIPIFEVKISQKTRDKFELESQIGLSKQRVDRAINNMQKMFEKGIRGVFISDPSSEDYKIMCKYKDEIQRYKIARDRAKTEYEETLNKLENAQNLLNQIEQRKNYFDSIEREKHNLEERLEKLEQVLENNKKHPFKFVFENLHN